jgi:acetolactate synthase small subunit
MEKSVLDAFVKTMEENKPKITRAREDARATRNDKALYELTVIVHAQNEAILAILKHLAGDVKP